MIKSLPFFLILAALPSMGFGALTVDIFESGPDVVFRVTGGVDLTGLTYGGDLSDGAIPQMTGGAASSIVLEGSNTFLPFYTGATPTISQFSAGVIGLSGISGSTLPSVGIANTGLVFVSAVLDGAPSTQVITGTLNGESLATLGINDGIVSSVSWISGSGAEAIQFRTGSAVPVPELSSALLVLLGAGIVARRRR